MSEPKRVLFTIGSLRAGGAERQVIQYLRHLDRTRFAPRLYLLAREGEMLADVPGDVPVLAFQDRRQAPALNCPGRIYRQQIRDLARVLAAERIDALCAVTMLMTLVAVKSVALRPTPWVCVEMSDPRFDFPLQIRRFRRTKYRLLQRAFREADGAVAVSEGTREGIREFYDVPDERLTTIYNFIDPRQIDALSAAPGPELDADRFHLVTVGRLVPVKGHIHLLQALDDLVHNRGQHNLQLHLLGAGPLEAELREFAASHELEGHVRFAGFQANPYAYLRHCQLFCLPSLYEGLPIALLEALLCGLPAVASDCRSGPREILADGRYGRLVPPADPTALADAIEETMRDYDRCRSQAEVARDHVIRNYAPESGMAKLETLIERICR